MFTSTRALAVAVLGLSASALTVPVRRDVTSGLWSELNLYEQYSAAAYCPDNFNATAGTTVRCSTGNCPLVEQASATVVYSFDEVLISRSAGDGDTTGLLIKDDSRKLFILSFRGSKTISNWLTNLDFTLTDASSLCDGCEAHKGFLEAWQSVSEKIESELSAAIAENKDYGIVVTGHSLGAALATLAAVELRNQGDKVDLYTYGCPRVGNHAFASFVTTQEGGTNYRVTHTDDPVPKVPPKSFGFSQPGPEYWVTAASNSSVSTSQITVVQGIDSDLGNDGTAVGLDIAAHLWYFNKISACG
ncbi:Alpha/Beta hydrolase protein [Talaromyces proteolyticus]|uniref:Alpha/Beta hydrolase protein n=1 Tax=Talaromyces proteolyticus TaxID=1131652 RepID=A0AAD4KQ09_9EURO|nr:Alpha/Beta hydrolase protein [Talaromyces proteolyticus]KAH8697777.1 Alpha/Beta hydrolase protein [Talaromyces proteolyticus]